MTYVRMYLILYVRTVPCKISNCYGIQYSVEYEVST